MSLIYDEIKNQYQAMRRCVEHLEARLPEIRALVEQVNPPLVVFMGCGSSFSLAKSMADTVNIRLKRPSFAVPAGDATVHAARYAGTMEGALIVPVSRSGSTSEVMFALDALKAAGCSFTVLSLSCAEHCKLSEHSALSIEMPWCFDESVCQTRTVSCLYYSVMYVLSRLMGNETLRAQLLAFPDIGERYVRRFEAEWEALAGRSWDHAVVLADAEIHGIAEEGALAFKEVCQLPSNCYHVLDVRHGPMVLIRDRTLVIAAIAGGPLEQDLIRDMVGHGSTVVTCTDRPLAIDGALNFPVDEDLDHIVRGLAAIVLCQLTAFYKSRVTGTDPDHPDGLDAWIKL